MVSSSLFENTHGPLVRTIAVSGVPWIRYRTDVAYFPQSWIFVLILGPVAGRDRVLALFSSFLISLGELPFQVTHFLLVFQFRFQLLKTSASSGCFGRATFKVLE
jgi:hypothetical protein